MRYDFKLDSLCKVWYRYHLSIEADTEKEAIERAIEIAKEENENGNIQGDEIMYCEPILETVEPVFIEDNQGNSTIELEFDSQIIWQNV